jgi:hypothetical protein
VAESLRPMSTGELMDRTLVLYKKNFKLFVGIAIVGPASYLVFQLLTMSSATIQAGTRHRVNPFPIASLGFGFFAGIFIVLAGMAIAHGATVRAVAAVHLGFPITIAEAYKSLKGKIWRLLGVFVSMLLLASLAAIAGALVVILVFAGLTALFATRRIAGGTDGVLFGMIIGFSAVLVIGVSTMIVWVRYALAVGKSLKRSATLSKGSRFRIFLIYIVFLIAGMLLGGALGWLAGALGNLIPNVMVRLILLFIAAFIGGALTGPLATIGIALLYYDERVRKEAFDLQLMLSSLDLPAPATAEAVPVQP